MRGKSPRQANKSSRTRLMKLEPRILFDAAAAAEVAQATDTAADASALLNDGAQAATDQAVAASATATLDTTQTNGDASTEQSATADDSALATTGATSAASSMGAHEIAFIDSTLPDAQVLAEGLEEGIEIVWLSADSDPWEQIGAALQDRQDVSAVHLVTHGTDGALVINGTTYTAASLDAYADDLSSWSLALTADADLLIYGCDVAATAEGQQLADKLATLTGADVAASDDDTGAGADWTLEYTTGFIESAGLLTAAGEQQYRHQLGTVDIDGADGWVPVMYGTGKDPSGDSQAGAADTDIIGDASHGSLYVGYADNGTTSSADDYVYFRLRIDNPTSSTNFSGVAIVGLDANGDGRIDLFMAVDGRNSSQSIYLLDPGSGQNTSPSTTTTSKLPSGWLSNNGIYPFTSANYSVTAVSTSTDPNYGDSEMGGTPTDLTDDGKTDVFVSWRIPVADLAAVLATPSPTDRDGNYGPRGATGIQGFGKDSTVSYVSFTQTQLNSINGDLNGVGAYDKNATFSQLGVLTNSMPLGDPISAAPGATISGPIAGNDLLNASEDDATTIAGTAAANKWVRLTISDTVGSGPDVTRWVQSDASGNWSLGGLDLHSLADGDLTLDARMVEGDGSNSIIAGSTGDTYTVLHDTLAPVLSIDPLATGGWPTPTISGTSDLPAGSLVSVTVDPDGEFGSLAAVVYQALVQTGGAWSVSTATAVPTSGTTPTSGFTSYAKITASAADAAGNSSTTDALVKPTVNPSLTNDTTPTLTGNWAGSNGGTDSLTVSVNGVTYTTSTGLSISGSSWSLTIPSALPTGTYAVTATVTRSGLTSTSDSTSNELQIVSGPAVGITGINSTVDTTPIISGTSTESSVLVRIDPNNDGNYSDAVTYLVPVSGGTWSLDTGSATPVSGVLSLSGLVGTFDVYATATDSSGVVATANSDFTVAVPSITISTISSPLASDTTAVVNNGDSYINHREDGSITVTGTSTNAVGQTLLVTVKDNYGNQVTGTATVASGGAWTVSGLNLSTLRDGALTFTASVAGGAAYNQNYTHDATAPVIVFTTPDTVKKSQPDISLYSDLPSGSTITVTTTNPSETHPVTLSSTGDATFQITGNLPTNSPYTTLSATSTATDTAGNYAATATDTQQAVNSISPPSVAISTITGVNYATSDTQIVSSELTANSGAITITGTTSITTGTLSLVISDGTTTYTKTPTRSGSTWTYTLTSSEVTALRDGSLTINATLTGGTATAYDTAIATLNRNSAALGLPPTVTITSASPDANLSASEDDAVTISGTTTVAAAGSIVSITVTDTSTGTSDVIGTATVLANGSWSTSSALNLSSLVDGTLTISASVTANSQTATANANILHDTVAPHIYVTSGPTLSDTTPVIGGTTDLLQGSVLTIAVDADNNGSTDATYQATVQSGGVWSLDTGTATPVSGSLPATGLAINGKVTVSGSDGAGNSSSVVAAAISAIDGDTGTSGSDFLTSDRSLIFSGKAEAGTSVGVYLDNVLLGTVTANASTGLWSYDYSGTNLAAGSHTLKAVSTNSAGNTATTTQTITVDTAAPAVAISAVSSDSGASASDFVTNDDALVFSGTAESGSNVLVTLTNASGTTTLFSTTVTATGGLWSVDRSAYSLPDGDYTLTATATDSAGNPATATRTLVVDTSASITLTTNSKSNDTTPLITGISDLEAGRSITVEIDPNNDGDWSDKQTYTAIVESDGSWSVQTATALSGTVGIRASGTDLAGNSYTTAVRSLTIDLAAPGIAIAEPFAGLGGDDLANASEDDTIVISGTTTNVPNGSTIRVTISDGTHTIIDTTVTNGTWSLAPLNLSSFNDGPISVTASYLDDSGIDYRDAASFSHDKTAPTPTLSAPSTAITGAVTVTVSFDEPVSGLVLGDFSTSNGATLGNLTQLNATTWTLTLTPAVNGTASLWLPSATVSDAAGNPGEASNILTFTVSGLAGSDTTAPSPISILRQNPSAETTNADTLVFAVTFSEPVVNVDASDFTLSGTGIAGASIGTVSGSGSTWLVTVTGVTSNNGTVDLTLASGATIQDTSNNSLTDLTADQNEGYTLDNIAPLFTSGEVIDNVITLTYGESGSGLSGISPATSAYSLSGTTATVTSVSVNPTTKTITLTLSRSVGSTDAIALTYTAPGSNPLQDVAGNASASFTSALTNRTAAADSTAPVIDLAPTDNATLNYSATSNDGASTGLTNGSATLDDDSNEVLELSIAVGGLQDGSAEKLVFGATTLAASGFTGTQTATLGGVNVSINYSGGSFVIQKSDYSLLSETEAQDILNAIQYRNDATTLSAGNRTFSFTTTDEAGNTSAAAVSTVNVTAVNDAPLNSLPAS
ncbi:DUF4347 domain-containing protein, partial [Azotobacter beijerinckii]